MTPFHQLRLEFEERQRKLMEAALSAARGDARKASAALGVSYKEFRSKRDRLKRKHRAQMKSLMEQVSGKGGFHATQD